MGSQGEAGLTPGSLVAGYRIERELGRGNMAVVYLATQMNLMRPGALKVLAPALASDEEYVCRFFNEARAAAALSLRQSVLESAPRAQEARCFAVFPGT